MSRNKKKYTMISGAGLSRERIEGLGIMTPEAAKRWLLETMAQRGKPGQTWLISAPGHTIEARWSASDLTGGRVMLHERRVSEVQITAGAR